MAAKELRDETRANITAIKAALAANNIRVQ